jgi:TonB family protein
MKVRWKGLAALPLIGAALISPPLGQAMDVKRVVGMEYPWMANLAGIQGKVTLLALISREGTVREVRLKSGHGLLGEAASKTLSRWVFSACLQNDEPCQLLVTFTFVLDGKCESYRCATEFVADLPDAVLVRTRAAPAIID